jgi:prepilin-type N-terminal cleavage/methylation domain-containing protein
MRPALSSPSSLRAVDGFTMIEVLVAIVVLSVAILGLVGAFDSARRLSLVAERQTAMSHRAQLEIERLQTYPYSKLAMISKPTHSAEKSNPDYYVKNCGSSTCYAWNAEKTSEEENLIAAAKEVDCTVKNETGCGIVSASPTGRECTEKVGACEWSDGLIKGYVYDFVTWHTDGHCGSCKASENYKRLTVVVTAKVSGGGHETTPLRVSTLIAEPL